MKNSLIAGVVFFITALMLITWAAFVNTHGRFPHGKGEIANWVLGLKEE